MIDMESLRNEMLIEERQNYENDFISIADIMKSEELDYYTGPQFEVYFEKTLESEAPNLDDFDYSFEFEDSLIHQRDEILIKEHEAYEKNNFEDIVLDLIVDDIFDHQIESFKEDSFLEEIVPDYDFDFEDYEDMQYEEEMSWEIHYLRESQFETQSQCGCPYDDYMPNDDGLCDYLDCYDYPEGPNENLSGIKYF